MEKPERAISRALGEAEQAWVLYTAARPAANSSIQIGVPIAM
jgi:hypothetical protein